MADIIKRELTALLTERRIDNGFAPVLYERLMSYIEEACGMDEETEINLIVDMTTVMYLSSAGIRTFLSVNKTLKNKLDKNQLVLRNVNEPVIKVLEITGLLEDFNVIKA